MDINTLFCASYAVHLHICSLPSQVLTLSEPSACGGWKVSQLKYVTPARQEQMFLERIPLQLVWQVCLEVLNDSPQYWIWNIHINGVKINCWH
jgi:hypothetical protein